MFGEPRLLLGLYERETFASVRNAAARGHGAQVGNSCVGLTVPWLVYLHALRVVLH